MSFVLALLLLWVRSAIAGPDLEPEALAHLVDRGRESHSNALLVWHKGKLVVEEYFGKKPHLEPLMSMTKSVVALGVARLVDDGKLKLDQPVSDYYAEWKQGRKRPITIRHLLNHTSGLQNEPNTTVEIYPAPDVVKLALAAELSDPPGSQFHYNNKAVNLLAGIIRIASGQRMDRYIDKTILRPLGITDARWEEHDKAGNPYAMSGLSLTGADMIRIGRLVLGGGSVDGKRIVSERVMTELLAPGTPLYPSYGLLWWRIPKWQTREVVDDAGIAEMRKLGVDEKTIADLTAIKGLVMKSDPEFETAMRRALGEQWLERFQAARDKGAKVVTLTSGPEAVGYYAEGYLGEYLVVIPGADLVAVRLVDSSDSYDSATDGFRDFRDAVRALVE